jgi:hypothetical protein
MQVKPLNNFVLLKAKVDNSKIKLEGGQILYLDTSFAKEKHSDVVCEVVAVPDRLVYGFTTDINPRTGKYIQKQESMDWKTDMELRVGDEVIIHYLAYVNAFGDDKRAFTLDGDEYFFCPYQYIYLAKRRWTATEEDVFWKSYKASTTKYITEDWKQQHGIVMNDKEIYNVVMLNGYILVQPVEKELKSKFLELPPSMMKDNKKKVKVCYAGKPNQEYINGVYYDQKVEPGNLAIVDKSIDVPLEAEDHRTFNEDEGYWRLQSCLIHALLNPDND